jgi:hypothetical protein
MLKSPGFFSAPRAPQPNAQFRDLVEQPVTNQTIDYVDAWLPVYCGDDSGAVRRLFSLEVPGAGTDDQAARGPDSMEDRSLGFLLPRIP